MVDAFLFAGTPSHSPSGRLYLTRSSISSLTCLKLAAVVHRELRLLRNRPFSLERLDRGESALRPGEKTCWHSYFIDVNLQFPLASLLMRKKQESVHTPSYSGYFVKPLFFSDPLWLLSTLLWVVKLVPSVDLHTICSPEGLPVCASHHVSHWCHCVSKWRFPQDQGIVPIKYATPLPHVKSLVANWTTPTSPPSL